MQIMQTPPRPDQVPSRRHLGRVVPIALAAVVALVGLALAVMIGGVEKPHLLLDPERRSLEITRARNLALANLNRPLPGTPDLAQLDARLAEHGLKLGAPVLVRMFKREHELELWLLRDGVFHRFATYPVCRWSGGLGPKRLTGDKQAPEGFYTVSAAQMNPNSRWYRSFNLGYPNAYDRAHGRTGSALMVHGGCSSAGCYAMTDPVIGEIWRIVQAALGSGQKRFQVQAYPFRMTEAALAAKADHPDIGLWRSLKLGHDLFEATLLPPRVQVCSGTYRFQPGSEANALTGSIETGCADRGRVAGEAFRTKKPL